MNSSKTTTGNSVGKPIGQQLIDAWNTRTDDAILAFYTTDHVVEDITEGRIREGWNGIKEWTKMVFTAFPDIHYTLLDHIETDGKLVLHWLAKGNHQGPLMRIPATGKNVAVHGMSILLMQEGKVKQGQIIWDMAAVLRQIGLLPAIHH